MSLASLISQKKILTVEFNPPKDVNISKSIERIKVLSSLIDAINITDSPMAKPRMNPIVASSFVKDLAYPIFNITCRDKNEIAIRSDLLAAHAVGLKNILAITGDPSNTINNNVYKMNVFGLIKLIYSINKELNLDFFVGCASNIPNSFSIKSIRDRLTRKVDLGAKFVITQPIFSKNNLEYFLESAKDINAYKIIGIMPIISHKVAIYLNNFVRGINIPLNILARYENTTKEQARQISIEIIESLLFSIKDLLVYIDGLHIMSLDNNIVKLAKQYLEG